MSRSDKKGKKGAARTPPFRSAPAAGRSGIAGTLLAHAGHGMAQPRPAAQGPEAAVAAARALHAQGRIAEAEAMYRKVLAQSPRHPRALWLLGLVAHQRENPKRAVELIRKSVRLDGSDAEAHNALGNALRKLGDLPKAIEAFRRAIALDDNFAGAWSNLGLLYRQQGDLGRAAECFEAALALDPDLPEAWNGLSRTGRFTATPARIAALEDLLAKPGLSVAARRSGYYALGKFCDETGDYDQAFAHYEAANTLREVPASAEGDLALIDAMQDAFGPRAFETAPRADAREGEPAPVFVVGMPRSGTTLVEQILASHPDVAAGGELNVLEGLVRDDLKAQAATGPDGRPDVAGWAAGLTTDRLAAMRKQLLAQFRGAGGKGTGKNRRGPAVVTDKTPFNFMLLGVVALAFPDARIIHCTRHPLDTGLSIFFTEFTVNRPFTTDLAAIGRYYAAYHRLMAHWRDVLPVPVRDVGYEALVADQEAETRALIEFCGLPWDDRCLAFFETRRHVATPSDWQVRQPMYGSAVGRWRHYARHLGPLRDALGDDVPLAPAPARDAPDGG